MVINMENTAVNTLSKSSTAESVSTEKHLTFFIDNQLFAIQSSHVVEIIRMQPITFMPKLPPFVKGVINLRGKIVPLIDLRLKLGKEPAEYDEHTSIVVVDTGDVSVGFIVDRVNDVTDIAKDQISESPKLAKSAENNYVTGIATLENEVAMILDPVCILTETDGEVKSEKAVQNPANAIA
jgi:purine-binding chemotaxis protein CheW